MNFALPTKEQLTQYARALNLHLESQEIDLLHEYLEPFAEGYASLEASERKYAPIDCADRIYRLPADEENLLGAWRVKTSIKRRNHGSLDGSTVVIKDNILLRGVPMSNGAAALEGLIPEYDAHVVTRMLDAGAEIKGKSTCEYLCLSGGSGTASSGVVQNPRRPGYSTGGSSSGSAALVVAGEVDMGLGTDQGGSVRIPASWTGACGMKGTRGLVSYSGAVPMESSIDYIGPITRTVRDNARCLEVIAGDDLPQTSQSVTTGSYTAALGEPIDGMRIAVVQEGFHQASSEADVDSCVMDAAADFRSLGASVDAISIPEHLEGIAMWSAIVSDGFHQTLKMSGVGYNYDGVYSQNFRQAMERFAEDLSEAPVNAKLLFLLGKHLEKYKGHYYAVAKNLAHHLRAAYDKAFEHYDLLVMPTTVQKPQPNPIPGTTDATDIIVAQAFGNILNTCQFNVSGHPAMSVPCGLRDGLPIGMMLVGRYYDEAAIYRAAYSFEQSTPWEGR
ncbi:MAG: amidase [Gammaproteobacteria bacterium]|nr:amidase [Gammaproteobacteria bacterium]